MNHKIDNIICCVDVGIKNLIFCIYNNNELLHNNKFKLTINEENFKKDLYIKIKLIYNYILKEYNPHLFLIEKQINKATNNIFIENVLIILCIDNNKDYKFINSSSKYIGLKKEFNIKKINKRQLKNFINIDLNKCLSFLINEENEINIIKTDFKKMDDFIDCILIFDYYKKYL